MPKAQVYRADVFEDYPATFLARMRDLSTGELITQASLTSVTYKIFDLSGPRPDTYLFAGTVSIPTAVHDDLLLDGRWEEDGVGFNFEHTLEGTYFPVGSSRLLLEYTFTPTVGASRAFLLAYHLRVLETRSVGAVASAGFGQGTFETGTPGGNG